MELKRAVLVDVDDTLSATQRLFIHHANKLPTTQFRYHQFRSLDREGGEWEQIVSHFLTQPELIATSKPFKKALTGMELLTKAGFQIHIASSRKKLLHQVTHDWLEKYGFMEFVAEIHNRPSALEGTEFKVNTAQKIDAAAAFDDTLSVVEALSNNGTLTYLIRRPWNSDWQKHPLIKRYSSFYRAVLDFLPT